MAQKRDHLKEALAEKPPTPSFMKRPPAELNPDYVPPPVVNLQATMPLPRRRPLPSELDQAPVREAAEAALEDAKREIGQARRSNYVPPTAEAIEASHLESVRQLKVAWSQRGQRGYDVDAARAREVEAHQSNLDYVKAEMARTVHTEDYSG